jgi:hypothetical protein
MHLLRSGFWGVFIPTVERKLRLRLRALVSMCIYNNEKAGGSVLILISGINFIEKRASEKCLEILADAIFFWHNLIIILQLEQ